MSSTKEKAARIRAEFKRAGFSGRQISVRTDFYSMGSSINVWLKTAAASYAWVTKVANSAEKISRCKITGDILSGGNCYVHVSHESEAVALLARRHIEALRVAVDKLPEGSSRIERVGETGHGVSRDGYGYSLWIDGRRGARFDEVEHGAYRLALVDPDQATTEPPSSMVVTPARFYPYGELRKGKGGSR